MNWEKISSTMAFFTYPLPLKIKYFPDNISIHLCLGLFAFLKTLALEVIYDK